MKKYIIIVISIFLIISLFSTIITSNIKENKIVIDNQTIIEKHIETYRCGNKNKDTCANYIFVFKKDVYNVSRDVYYLNHVNSNITLLMTQNKYPILNFISFMFLFTSFVSLLGYLIFLLFEEF